MSEPTTEPAPPARTSPRVIIIHAVTIKGLREAIPGLIAGATALGVSGSFRAIGIIGIVAAIVVAIIGLATLNWWRFSYQIANRQLIVSQGIFNHRVRSIPIDRIRTIDSESGVLHRILRLARLRIDAAAAGTGKEEAVIDGLPTAAAAALRAELLAARRVAAKPAAGEPADAGARVGPAGSSGVAGSDQLAAGTDLPVEDDAAVEEEYSRSRPQWLLYAPLVGSYLALPLAAFGVLSQFVGDLPDSWFSWLNIDPGSFGVGDLVLIVLGAVVVLILGSIIGAAVLNWRFRLFRRDDLLISERGLLTRRVISTEIARIRGYTLSEGLGMRLVRAARLTALVTGVTAQNSRSQLLPVGPVDEARSVADRAVRPFDGELRGHPRAALRRRLIRSVGPGLVVVVVGIILGLWQVWVPGLVLAVLGVPLGIDRYRSLGHVADVAGLAVRSGSLARQTTVLERRALVGWKVGQSFFQRRAGLVTVTALVGAGGGGYQALDAGAADGLSLTQHGSGRWAGALVPTGPTGDAAG